MNGSVYSISIGDKPLYRDRTRSAPVMHTFYLNNGCLEFDQIGVFIKENCFIRFCMFRFSLLPSVGTYHHLYIFMYTFICIIFPTRIWDWDGRVFQLVY